jgi:hypothetical protein
MLTKAQRRLEVRHVALPEQTLTDSKLCTERSLWSCWQLDYLALLTLRSLHPTTDLFRDDRSSLPLSKNMFLEAI